MWGCVKAVFLYVGVMMVDVDTRNIVSVPDLKNNLGITILHWNSRSMYHKYDEILHLVEGSNCEFLFLSETWLSDDVNDDMIKIPGYQLLRQDRNEKSDKQRGGGVCVYHKNRFVVTRMDELSFCSPDVELLTIKVKLKNTRDIYYSCVYRPPSGNVERFIETMENVLGKIWNKAKVEYNMIGDININWLARGNRETKLYKEFCKRAGFTALITNDTHYSKGTDSSSCLDHIMTSAPALYSQHGLSPYMESDHVIIYAARKKFKVEHEKTFVRARSYRNFNAEAFSRAVDDYDWSYVYNTFDVDTCWNNFCHGFISIMDRFLPFKNMRFGEDYPKWADSHFFSSANERDRAIAKVLKHRTAENIAKAKRLRNSVTAIKRNLQRDYFRQAFENAGKDNKKTLVSY